MKNTALLISALIVTVCLFSFQGKKARPIVGLKHKGGHIHVPLPAIKGHMKHGDSFELCKPGHKCYTLITFP